MQFDATADLLSSDCSVRITQTSASRAAANVSLDTAACSCVLAATSMSLTGLEAAACSASTLSHSSGKQCMLWPVDHVNSLKLSVTSQANGRSFVLLLADCT